MSTWKASPNPTKNPDRTVTDRFVTEDFDAAKRVLTDLGASFTEQVVLELHNPDKPGVLAKVAGVLGNADINIESIYFSTPGARNDTNVYIGVSPHKLAEAEKLLHGLEH